MIDGYKITKQGNDEVLFLYFNFDYEFSSNFSDKPFFKTIKDFIKNINFKGTKIFIVSSGIIIGTLMISPIKIDDISSLPYNYVSKVIIHDYYEDSLTNYEINVNEPQNNLSNTLFESNIIEKEDVKNVNSNESVNDNVSSNKNNDISQPASSNEEVKEANKIFVTVSRSNGTILNIELEQYLIGVVGAEMPASFDIEALKAQAVVARTYTLRSIKNGKALTDTISTQVYKDDDELKKIWGPDYTKYYQKIKAAVSETMGKVILYNNQYIDAVYHSTSNGFTESSENVWGNKIPYLVSVESYDKNVSSYQRSITISKEEFCYSLSLDVLEPITYEIIHNNTGRVSVIIVNNKSFSGIEFRELLNLRSTGFNINIDESNIIITTYGYGHGVGMSQYGANEMAKSGNSYIQILKHYYTGVIIK